MRHNRQVAFAFIAVIATALHLAGVSCKRSASEGRQITIAVNAGVEGDGLKAAARDYERQFGIRVNIAEFPYANLFEKELVDLANNTGAYDIIMLDDPWFPRFAAGGHMAELEPLYARKGLEGPDEDFVEASLRLCRHPYATGKLYALPYVGNCQLFFYRQDLFEKHGLQRPRTWEDVLRAARIISEKEGIYGYVMRAAQGNAIVADFMPIFWAFGAEMFDESGRPTVNSPEGVAALRLMIELGRYCPPGYVSFNADEVSAHLLQGTAAMAINWPAWVSAFEDPTRSKVVGKMAYATVPGQRRTGSANIGNWLLAIPRGSKNKELAFDFMLWATSPEQMKVSALRGNPPTRRSLFKDPELIKQFKSYAVHLESLEASRPRPRTPLWNEIENALGIYLSRANSGQMSPEEAMSRANQEIARIIERGM